MNSNYGFELVKFFQLLKWYLNTYKGLYVLLKQCWTSDQGKHLANRLVILTGPL